MHRLIKYMPLAFLLSLFSTAGAQKISLELEESLSRTPPDSAITVLVRPALEVEIYKLENELLRKKASRAERHRRVIGELKRKSDMAQADLRTYLKNERQAGRVKSYRPFWIVNLVAVTASPEIIRKIAEREDVAEILDNRPIFLQAAKKKKTRAAADADATSVAGSAALASNDYIFNWGLRRIMAHKLWERGLTGKGILVATIDSGVDGDHPALRDKWRAANGATVSESWYDPWKGGSFPVDDAPAGPFATHGTHVMGCIVGQDGADTTGVAPDAQWISANGFEVSGAGMSGPPSTILDCFEWVADPDREPETIDDVPDILNLSWVLPVNQGCASTFDEAINNVTSLGVTVTIAIGNDASKIGVPASKPEFFAVGAVDETDSLASFSIRGPSICDNITIKPDVVAPGNAILSPQGSLVGGGYSTAKGTSFASPLVAGIAALLKQFNPELPPDEITEAIRNSATDLGVPGPDNEYGWGLVNAEAALSLVVPASSPDFAVTAIQVTAGEDNLITPGEQARIILRLTSIGAGAAAVTATVTSNSPDVTVNSGFASFGDIPNGGEASNSQTPFVLAFSPQMPDSVIRTFFLQVTSGSLTRTVSFALNVGGAPEQPRRSVAGHTVGKAALSLTNYGVIGTDADDGGGFKYPYIDPSTPDHLYQGALLIATGPDSVSDAAYNEFTQGYELEFDQDFSPIMGGNIQVLYPGIYADQEITGAFTDDEAANSLGVKVYQTSYAWSADADDDYVIVEYVLWRPEDSDLAGVYLAQHLDWDVGPWSDSGNDDLVGFDSELNLAYMYDKVSNTYVGHTLLTQQVAGFRAINFLQDVSDGLTEEEKFSFMTSGVGDTLVGTADDWSELLSAGPLRLKPGREVVVAFALAGGGSLAELRTHATAARERYQQLAGQKSIDMAAPSIVSEPYADADLSLDSYLIQAVVTDESELDAATLFWRLEGAENFTGLVEMEPGGEPDTFKGRIPGQARGRVIEYYLEAVDAQGNIGYAPEGAPGNFYSFQVIDTLPPQLSISSLPGDTGDTEGPYPVSLIAADPGGISRVELVYSSDDQAWRDTLELTAIADSLYQGEMPGGETGTVFRLFFQAEDSSGNLAFLPQNAPGEYFTFSILYLEAPVISNTRVFYDTVAFTDTYILQAELTDNRLSQVYAVLGFDEQAGRDTVELTPLPEVAGTFSAAVEGYPRGTWIDFYIVATDSAGNVTTDPATAPDSMYSFEFQPPLSGDINLSGAVNIFDLIDMLKILSGSETLEPERLWIADLDRNGRFDIFDLLEMLRILSEQ